MQRIGSLADFEQAVAHEGLTVIKFYTDWCPDCHRVAAAYEEYARDHRDQALFADVNAEEVPEAAERYDVRGIPTLLVFRNGALVDRLYSRDCKTPQQMVAFLDKTLNSNVNS